MTVKMRWWSWIVLVTSVAAAIALGALVVTLTGSSSSTSVCDATSVSNEVLPSVVTISASSARGAAGTGSGEVIRSNGYILTNNHVISVAANGGSLEVTFSDGDSAPATITGRDPATDLAVIKVSEPEPLPVIGFSSSDDVQVGEPVVVLGAPLGLSSTVTTGIVSALGRTITVPADEGKTALLVSAIQTDAAINPGNSGGAMTNCSGDLIGVPTAGAAPPNPSGQSSSGSVGLGFAIPSSFAEAIADELISTGSVSHSYLGLQVAPIPPAAAQQGGTSEGLFVVGVTPGGPAASAGLSRGDVITEIDSAAATDATQLASLELTKKPGDSVTITYERSGHSAETTVTLGTQP